MWASFTEMPPTARSHLVPGNQVSKALAFFDKRAPLMVSPPPEAPTIAARLAEPAQGFGQYHDLPEELILAILAWLDKPGLLLCSRVCRQLNRLTIPQLLLDAGIPDPTSYCKIILHPTSAGLIDALTILNHSVHINSIKDLSFYFTSFRSYSSLAGPLRRAIACLNNLEVEEITLYFGTRAKTDHSKNEKFLKEIVPLFEQLLNTIVVRSTKKIRLFGSEGLLEQYYTFRPPSSHPSTSHSESSNGYSKLSGERPKSSSSKFTERFKRPLDYLDRRQHKHTTDPIILDDLCYTRTSLTGSRISLHCSPAALENSKLTHINLGTADFLRPPFSQWTLSILRASKIQSISFSFAHLPNAKDEEAFVLKRLAAVLPGLKRLYLFDLTEDVMPTLVLWINKLSTLERLQVEPFVNATLNSDGAEKSCPALGSGAKLPCFYTFAPSLKRVDGPHHFLKYLFDLGWRSHALQSTTNPSGVPDTTEDSAAAGGSIPTLTQRSTSPTPSCTGPLVTQDCGAPGPTSPEATSRSPPNFPSSLGPFDQTSLPPSLNIIFPSLDLIHLDYYCIKGVRFDIATLANTILTIKPNAGGFRSVLDRDAILVHLKFDANFAGLAEAEAEMERLRAVREKESKGVQTTSDEEEEEERGGEAQTEPTVSEALQSPSPSASPSHLSPPPRRNQSSARRNRMNRSSEESLDCAVTISPGFLADIPHPSFHRCSSYLPDSNAYSKTTTHNQGPSLSTEISLNSSNNNDFNPPHHPTLRTLAAITKLRIGLPGSRGDIVQGRFNSQIFMILSLFWGCKNLRLVAAEHGTFVPPSAPLSSPGTGATVGGSTNLPGAGSTHGLNGDLNEAASSSPPGGGGTYTAGVSGGMGSNFLSPKVSSGPSANGAMGVRERMYGEFLEMCQKRNARLRRVDISSYGRSC